MLLASVWDFRVPLVLVVTRLHSRITQHALPADPLLQDYVCNQIISFLKNLNYI